MQNSVIIGFLEVPLSLNELIGIPIAFVKKISLLMQGIMGKSAESILRKFKKEKKLTFEEIKELYQDRSVQEVDFVTAGNAFLITQIRLKNGEKLSFQ